VKSNPNVAQTLQNAQKAQYEFRVSVDGESFSEGDVVRSLNSCEDRGRREKVWRAQEQSLALAPMKQGLAAALNDATRASEWAMPTFMHLVLRAQDTGVDRLRSLILDFEQETRGAAESFREEVRAFSGLPELAPWDTPYYVTKYLASIKGDLIPNEGNSAMQLLKRTLAAMGFPGAKGKKLPGPGLIDRPPFTFDILGGEGYAPEECSLWAGPGAKDYRVFINPELSPTGLDLTRTVFMESGHIIHYSALDSRRARSAFKWDSDCMRNAVAMQFDSLVEDAKWLHDIAGLEPEEAEQLSRLLKMKKMDMARKLAAAALFEMKLYLGEEPGSAFREVQELFAGSKLDYEVEKRWAIHPHLAYNPAGQASYVLGYLIFRIMDADIRSRFGGDVLHPGVADYLAENYLVGYQAPWFDRFMMMSGIRLFSL
jgi:hypothetical protein